TETPTLIFLLNHTAPTTIYTLSLHDALPIFPGENSARSAAGLPRQAARQVGGGAQERPHRQAHQDVLGLRLLRRPLAGARGRLYESRRGVPESDREEPGGEGEDLRAVRGHPGPGLSESAAADRLDRFAAAGRKARRDARADGAGPGSGRPRGRPRAGLPAGAVAGAAARQARAAVAAGPGPSDRGKV